MEIQKLIEEAESKLQEAKELNEYHADHFRAIESLDCLTEAVKLIAEQQAGHWRITESGTRSLEHIAEISQEFERRTNEARDRIARLEEDQAALTASVARRIVALEVRIDRLEEAEDGELECDGGKGGENA